MPAARHSNKRSQARAKGAGRAAATARKGHSGELPDVTALSDDELEALVEVIEQERESRRVRQREEFFASIRERARELGVQPAELAAELSRTEGRGTAESRVAESRVAESRAAASRASDGRAKVAPKYRNPADADETWAGRGVKPKWMQALLAQGRTMDEFKIAT